MASIVDEKNVRHFAHDVFSGLSYQQIMFGSNTDQAENSRQAIIWGNVGRVYLNIYMRYSVSMSKG